MTAEAVSENASLDRRVAQRKRCLLPVTNLVGVGCPSADARNLSAAGLFLSGETMDPLSAVIRGRLTLPSGHVCVEFTGEVVRRAGPADGKGAGVGVRFRETQSSNLSVWTAYLLDQHVAVAVKQIQRRSAEKGGATETNLKPLRNALIVTTLFQNAAREQAVVELLWRGRDLSQRAILTDRFAGGLVLSLATPSMQTGWNRYDLVYGRIRSAAQWFYFESYVVSMQGQELRIIEPEVVLFAERRVEPRRLPTLEMTGVVEIGCGAANSMPVKHQLLEATESGASFVVGSGAGVPKPGDFLPALSVRTEKGVSPDQQGSVVYANPFRSGDFRVGVQFHIDRCPLRVHVIDFRRRRPLVPFTGPLIRGTRRAIETIGTRFLKQTAVASGARPVRYRTERGNEIAAYVNATGPWPPQGALHEAPVVIIPPAFARRKETTGLLARTLVETFRHQGRDLVVIRFDGISSVGESTNLADPSYWGEMACYTLSQLVDDIRETVRYATSMPFFSPQAMTLVTFSMASVAARHFLAESENSTMRQWISCMGASDSDDLMRNSTGGIDYLADFENGEHLGVKEVLGQLVDLDRFCRDVILNRMAYLQDARRDLARISTPVTWIYGKYDYWINRRRVLDIMSIRTSARRHVYEVPCGHIVRTGEDALDVFGLITSLIWTDHYSTQITPRIPSESERMEFERAEWGRVQQPHLDLRRYWRSYLLGSKPGEIGFDILTLTDEYLGLMDRQIELLDIRPTDLVVDLGGGTGNFGLRYLEHSGERGQSSIEGPRIVLVDFVRRALDAARNKHLRKTSIASGATFSYVEANLDLGGDNDRIPLKTGSVSRVLASLFLSYVHEPELVLRECARLLRPGGLLVASTLLPDTDMSLPIHRLVKKIKAGSFLPYFSELDRETILIALQSYINSAARLTDLEEQRLFRFFSESELKTLVEESGFLVVDLYPAFGDPPQGVIIVGRRC